MATDAVQSLPPLNTVSLPTETDNGRTDGRPERHASARPPTTAADGGTINKRVDTAAYTSDITTPCPRSYCSLYHVNLYVLLLQHCAVKYSHTKHTIHDNEKMAQSTPRPESFHWATGSFCTVVQRDQ